MKMESHKAQHDVMHSISWRKKEEKKKTKPKKEKRKRKGKTGQQNSP